MINSLFKYEWRTLILLVLVLTTLVAIASSVIYLHEREEYTSQFTRHAEFETELVSKLITEGLTKGDYITVEQFVTQWTKERPELVEVKLTTASGFILAHYISTKTTQYRSPMSQRIDYGDRGSVTMYVVWDTSSVQKNLDRLLINLMAGYLTLVTALLLFTWWVLRHVLLRPLHGDIEESEQQQRDLLNNSPSVIYIKDIEGRFLFINRTFENLFQITNQEITGKTDYDLFQKDKADAFRANDLMIIGTGTPVEFEEIAPHDDGDHIYISTKFPIRKSSGEIYAVCGISTDITDRKRAETGLKQQRDFNDAVLEAAGNIIVVLDRSGCFVQFNRAAEELTGFRREQILGQSAWDWVIPEDQKDSTRQIFDNLVQNRVDIAAQHENDWLTHDGSRRTLDWHNTVLSDDTGTITHVVALGYDITERKQTENALRESERRLSTLMTNLPGMAYRCLNVEPWTMLFISDACKNITGYTPADLINNSKLAYVDLIHPDDADMVWNTVQAAIKQGRPFQMEYRIRTQDGDWRWVWEQGHGISKQKNQTGILEGYIADITEQHYLSEEIRDAQKELQGLLDDMQTMTGIMDVDGTLTFINNTPLKILGVNEEDVLGKKIWDGAWLNYDTTVQETIKNDITKAAAGEYVLHDQQIYTLNGLLWIEFSVHPVKDAEGRVKKLVAEGRDISQRKHAEDKLLELNTTLEARVEERTHELTYARDQADAANQAKSNFLSNMSHEIRSPLAAIVGFSESLATDKFGEEERRKITSTIVRNSKHLQQVIDDILDLSKIEAEQLEIEQISTSIFALMGDVDSLLGMGARDKGLEFKITYHFPLPANIETDPTCLKQILVNLCSNAIKFTNKGRVEVDVGCDENFRNIRFVVTDTGIGMTPNEIERIFDPFAQADSSTTRKYGGTGLGLSISSRLAQALDGSLTCESRKGQGSRFILNISNHDTSDVVRINRLEEAGIYYDEQREQVDIRPLTGRILLVEDIPDNQQLVAMYIRKTGAELTIVGNGKLALEKVLNQEFDLILMDMQMPVMDGLEAISRLRANGYKRPIVSLTANALISDREKCEAAGADGYLVKPIELHQFYRTLNKYLKENKTAGRDNSKQTLQNKLHNNPQYNAMVKRFLDNLPGMLEELSKAHHEKDWDTLQTKSHDLKGMGGAMGYPEITEKAGQINLLVKKKKHDQVQAAFNDLVAVCPLTTRPPDNNKL